MRQAVSILFAVATLAALAVAAVYLSVPSQEDAPAVATPHEEASAPESGKPDVCIQLITPARNAATGEIREFPTPCDVPGGWETIRNEEPGLDADFELQ